MKRRNATRGPGPVLGVFVSGVVGVVLAAAAGVGCGETRPTVYEPASTRQPGETVVTLPAADGPVELTVELALTPAARDRGLMYRTDLAPDAGMLFVFPSDEPRTFWMRNTLIPLDILFLDADGTIQNVAHGEPFVEQPGYHSARPARMVLELNAGWCEAHGVRAGARVTVEPSVLALPEA